MFEEKNGSFWVVWDLIRDRFLIAKKVSMNK